MLNNSGFFMKRIMECVFLVAFVTVGSCFASYYGELLEVEANFDRIDKTVEIIREGKNPIQLIFSGENEFFASISHLLKAKLNNDEEIDIVSKIFFILFNEYAEELKLAYNDERVDESYFFTRQQYTDKEGKFKGMIEFDKGEPSFKVRSIDSEDYHLPNLGIGPKKIFEKIFKSILLLLSLVDENIKNKIQNIIGNDYLELYAYVDNFNEKDKVVILSTKNDGIIDIYKTKNNYFIYLINDNYKKYEYINFYNKAFDDKRIFVESSKNIPDKNRVFNLMTKVTENADVEDYYPTLMVEVGFDRIDRTVKIYLDERHYIDFDFSDYGIFSELINYKYGNQLTLEEIDNFSKIFFTLFNGYADELKGAYDDQSLEGLYSSYIKTPDYINKEGRFQGVVVDEDFKIEQISHIGHIDDNLEKIFDKIFETILFLLIYDKNIANKIIVPLELHAFVENLNEKNQVVRLSTKIDNLIEIIPVNNNYFISLMYKKYDSSSNLFYNKTFDDERIFVESSKNDKEKEDVLKIMNYVIYDAGEEHDYRSLEVEVGFDRIKEILKIDIDGIGYIELDFNNYDPFFNLINDKYGDSKDSVLKNDSRKVDLFSKIFFTLFNGYANELREYYDDQALEGYSSYIKTPDYTNKEGKFVGMVADKDFRLEQISHSGPIDDNLEKIFEKIFKSILLFLLLADENLSEKIRVPLELFAYYKHYLSDRKMIISLYNKEDSSGIYYMPIKNRGFSIDTYKNHPLFKKSFYYMNKKDYFKKNMGADIIVSPPMLIFAAKKETYKTTEEKFALFFFAEAISEESLLERTFGSSSQSSEESFE
jgi:hypothetical protein